MRYFGYGSNLNSLDLDTFCLKRGLIRPRMERVTSGYVPDHQLGFNYKSISRKGGVLNIKKKIGSVAEGVLFDVHPDMWEILDAKEGAPNVYRRKKVIVLTSSGSAEVAWTYVIRDDKYLEFVKPDPAYVEVVKDGLISNHLGVEDLINASENRKLSNRASGFFVYGTLLSGLRNHGVIASNGLTCCVPAKCNGMLYDTNAGYPAMKLAQSNLNFVNGEYIVPSDLEKVIRKVDCLEGFSDFLAKENLYDRRLIQVEVHDHSELAWIYVYTNPHDHFKHIESGDWRQYNS